jgi:regulator of replication initiation timing
MIVLTDGRNNTETAMFPGAIDAAKSSGTTLLAVGLAEALMSELQQIASAIAGTQTAFFTPSFANLSGLLGSLTSLLPTTVVRNMRVQLTLGPEFTPTAVRTNLVDSVVTLTGNDIEWTAERPVSPMQISLDFRRANTAGVAAQLLSSFVYEDAEGRDATFQNASIALAGCDTRTMETEIQALQRQVTDLSAMVGGLQNQVSELTAANQALVEQIAMLQQENEGLRRQLAGQPTAPTGTGAMSGSGVVIAGRLRNVFELHVTKLTDGNLKMALTFKVCEQLDGQGEDHLACLNRLHRLDVSYFTAVQFSDDPSSGPSGDPTTSGVDRLTLSGVGSWDGIADHRFSVTATDRGDAAVPNTDTFQIEITSPDGNVVGTILGTLASGNLEIR